MDPRVRVFCALCLLLLLGGCGPAGPAPEKPALQEIGRDGTPTVALPTRTPAPATATATATGIPSPTPDEPVQPSVTPTGTPAPADPTLTPAAPSPTVAGTTAPTIDAAAQETSPASTSDYLRLRKSYATVLTRHRPAPYNWYNAPLPAGVSEVWYPSGDLKLRAWLALPEDAPAKVPAVVYFHGYFGLGWEEFEHCRPFLDAGYAVLLPALRGENGNPGNFELWYGEIEDARAAVRWLAEQPYIDAGRLYAFGWSVGGGVSTLLSLWDDVPVRLIGSCGGLYPEGIFAAWEDIVPFDLNDEQEKRLRLLRGNMASLQQRHIAYLGQGEWLAEFAAAAEAEARACGAPFTVQLVPGDHYTALPRAMAAFVEVMNADR